MIDRLRLLNFQSHERTDLKFGPGLNVITGPTDSGKTAIIRALRWALYNEPLGDAYVRSGAQECEVAVIFGDGATVIRGRRGRTNECHVVLPGQDEMRFEAFGTEPPPEVAEASGMPKVTIGDKELAAGFAFQLDPPFLLSESPLAAAKVLGKLAGTEEADHAGRMTAAEVHRWRQEERRLTIEAGQVEEELHRFDGLPELERRTARLNTLLAETHAGAERLARLRVLADSIRGILDALEAKTGRLAFLKPVAQLGDALGSLESRFQRSVQVRTHALALHQTVTQTTGALEARKKTDAVLSALPATRAAESSWSRFALLAASASRLHPVAEGLSLYSARLETLKPSEQAGAVAGKCERIAPRLRQLEFARRRLDPVSSDLKGTIGRLRAAEAATFAIPAANAAAALAIFVVGLETQRTALRSTRDELSNARARLSQETILTGEREAEYISLLVEAGVCPTCGSSVDPKHLKEVLSGERQLRAAASGSA